jgi:hypothetical protein
VCGRVARVFDPCTQVRDPRHTIVSGIENPHPVAPKTRSDKGGATWNSLRLRPESLGQSLLRCDQKYRCHPEREPVVSEVEGTRAETRARRFISARVRASESRNLLPGVHTTMGSVLSAIKNPHPVAPKTRSDKGGATSNSLRPESLGQSLVRCDQKYRCHPERGRAQKRERSGFLRSRPRVRVEGPASRRAYDNGIRFECDQESPPCRSQNQERQGWGNPELFTRERTGQPPNWPSTLFQRLSSRAKLTRQNTTRIANGFDALTATGTRRLSPAGRTTGPR